MLLPSSPEAQWCFLVWLSKVGLRFSPCTLLTVATGPAGTLAAQLSSEPVGTQQFSYEQRYGELRELQAAPNRVAPVTQLVLKRDAGQFTFGQGTFYLLTPIGGRTMGAVFVGSGVFSFSPPSRIEQERLAIFQKTKTLEAPFSSVVLLFADSTLAELESKLTFGPGQPPSEPRQRFKEGIDYLGNDDTKSFDPDLMAGFLNGESSDLFYAHIDRRGGSPLMFMLNPHEIEGVTLAQRVRDIGWTQALGGHFRGSRWGESSGLHHRRADSSSGHQPVYHRQYAQGEWQW